MLLFMGKNGKRLPIFRTGELHTSAVRAKTVPWGALGWAMSEQESYVSARVDSHSTAEARGVIFALAVRRAKEWIRIWA